MKKAFCCKFNIVSFTIVCVLAWLSALSFMAEGQNSLRAGTAHIYTGSEVPGDPNRGLKILENTFNYINTFREKNGGEYPSRSKPLISDMVKNSQTYGFKSAPEVVKSLSNVDNQYSDYLYIRASPLSKGLPANFYNRPDGNKLGSAKEKNSIDVLAFSITYVHRNGVDVAKTRSRSNPVGFYLVLYADGKVKRIGYDRILFAYNLGQSDGKFGYTFAFPNQAGVPYNTLSYEEYWDVVFGRDKFPFPLLDIEHSKKISCLLLIMEPQKVC